MSMEKWTMGNCLYATTGMSRRSRHLFLHNEVRAHLVQELHLWHLSKQAQEALCVPVSVPTEAKVD